MFCAKIAGVGIWKRGENKALSHGADTARNSSGLFLPATTANIESGFSIIPIDLKIGFFNQVNNDADGQDRLKTIVQIQAI